MTILSAPDPESLRLAQDADRTHNWKRWGPYLSERQWGTVREDYSASGAAWDYFPHDHARSRAYRWGEDGLLGFTDRQCRLCFALALWNENDPILKERLFGLTGPQGNHGEDVKELYYYLDSTPTHAYARSLYKYPHARFPYEQLVETNAARGRGDDEYELTDTNVFAEDRYFDVFAEYAKAGPNDLSIRITAVNRGPDPAPLHVLPTLWFRNTWIWGCRHEGCTLKPVIRQDSEQALWTDHQTLGQFRLEIGPGPDDNIAPILFTENETNNRAFFGTDQYTPYTKDAFHALVVDGKEDATNPRGRGTKAAAHYRLLLGPGEQASFRLRLSAAESPAISSFGADFDNLFDQRISEADTFYGQHVPENLTSDENGIVRQAYAGLLWSKQFYHYIVDDWLDGDPNTPPPPLHRRTGRNTDWPHMFGRDVISMPDKWEYPWFAAWDLAFHMIPFARIDPGFAKRQLRLLLREWYLHPNGQIPAYEFNFSDVNPPVHAWAVWRVYKLTGPRGQRDRTFLAGCFHKLLMNFTWWVNRKDPHGNNLFAGGFLGLDNIGVFDRSHALPEGGHLEQADGTAWMAFYCSTMLAIALELAKEDPVYDDLASKFFEHFVAIVDAMNQLGGTGLWSERDGFYYDQLHLGNKIEKLRVRSMVGIIPLFAIEVLDEAVLAKLPGFRKRLNWFLKHRSDLARHITCMEPTSGAVDSSTRYLLAIPSRKRLQRVLKYVLDPDEFLSPFGIRSLSAAYGREPFTLNLQGSEHRVAYDPGESRTEMFGGNSNWRGPIWFPLNYLLIEALQRYHHYYGDSFQVECPVGSGNMMNLAQVADNLSARLCRIFTPETDGRRPCHGGEDLYTRGSHERDLLLFHEYFHGDSGRGLGASHQTGWTALIIRCLEDRARQDL